MNKLFDGLKSTKKETLVSILLKLSNPQHQTSYVYQNTMFHQSDKQTKEKRKVIISYLEKELSRVPKTEKKFVRKMLNHWKNAKDDLDAETLVTSGGTKKKLDEGQSFFDLVGGKIILKDNWMPLKAIETNKDNSEPFFVTTLPKQRDRYYKTLEDEGLVEIKELKAITPFREDMKFIRLKEGSWERIFYFLYENQNIKGVAWGSAWGDFMISEFTKRVRPNAEKFFFVHTNLIHTLKQFTFEGMLEGKAKMDAVIHSDLMKELEDLFKGNLKGIKSKQNKPSLT